MDDICNPHDSRVGVDGWFEEVGHSWTARRIRLGTVMSLPQVLLLKPVIFPDTTNETMTMKK